jgi:nicotinate-nucleotide--dimethylbenzimidazole phosphoribosyltransferase
MQLLLTGLKKIEYRQDHPELPVPNSGLIPLKVRYCAICRTDAKMWSEGHRDLVLPRVPGHEVVVEDETGQRYTVWPGRNCGKCIYCLRGRENLCDEMKIMGFHHDGGFSDTLAAPPETLIPVPDNLASPVASFTEPVGCVFNALEHLHLHGDERAIIYGGGTMGLIAALVLKQRGVVPLIVEKDARKIAKSGELLSAAGIECGKDTTDSEFDIAINACPAPTAFSLCLTKLAKGGRLAFFSGLTKNEYLDTDLVNLIHYKETEIVGSYGLTKGHMRDALLFVEGHGHLLEKLIEDIISPGQVMETMPQVLSGEHFKFIIDFTKKDHPIG